MKSIAIACLLAFTCLTAFSQERLIISKELQDYGVRIDDSYYQSLETYQSKPPYKNTCFIDIGMTYYDLQTNASTQKRIHVFDDGTMGVVWTMGFDYPGFSDDRGTGYNYFDGENWSPIPTERLESDRTGWPEYTPFGENGEIIVSHLSGADENGLMILNRENKGMGDWEETIFQGPQMFGDLIFPRIATGGVDHSMIHLIAVTNPMMQYQGQEPALVYSRSIDGGVNWFPENYVIPEINSNFYNGFMGDTYDIKAEGDLVGILIGDSWYDLLLLKSTDNGDTWAKTIIWEHPYPMWNFNNMYPTDTFYCADGTHSLDFDDNGIAHVVFGINRTVCDGAGTYWFPAVGGIGYWNENRPSFTNNLNALSPYGHPDSELEEDYSLIGWTQDINNNGQLDILDDWGTYYLGFSSMPQIYCNDSYNEIFVVYSSVTETFDNGVQNYRHIWSRRADDPDYWGSFDDLTGHPAHIFDECVFPSLANYSDNTANYYLTFQRDDEPGLAVRGDCDPYGMNFITYMKTSFFTGLTENQKQIENLKVSQNIPNPFSDETLVQIEITESCNISLEVTNLTGQKVLEISKGYLPVGIHNIILKADGLGPGLYFYTVNAGEFSVTKKMIVE